ncbi:TetR family transcriptional regulator [Halioglobus sp. HI00S01]|uniref:S9 family peptidase n=1 Tax=Halioglobus sp. HI00S01 TaxID=1822214 RepID=UPI0007C3BD4E|nr:alpha/beta fold hydrolase [Halioglobus sp. HI00S01]KZX59316.1 TetR family transcriptional regulator [Halioglobus sp. HI00S01]
MKKIIAAITCFSALLTGPAYAEVERTTANNGQLVMEDVPPIPEQIARDLRRYQNVRSASFLAWTPTADGLYVSTRFGDVAQVHKVSAPGGARTQLTFFDEPVRSVQSRPGDSALSFTMDTGGNENTQIYLLEPGSGEEAKLLTDGEALNGSAVWDQAGERIAYRSTRRNGASNDIWIMDVDKPDEAKMVFASPDGTYWYPIDFSADGRFLLFANLVGNADSRIHLLDLASGEHQMLAGDPKNPSSNAGVGFDETGQGFWYTTDMAGDFRQLAWQSLEVGDEPMFITADIPWHVDGVRLSEDRGRIAFAVNENGFSQLYLLDSAKKRYKAVKNMPVGVLISMGFSPDNKQLALTLNTPNTPSDTFVLELGRKATSYGDLTRWTFSEVGGLDTAGFIEPELISYPTFDSGKGGPDAIPAWLYKPKGEGPFPVIISIHGGPEAQARPYFSSTYQLWLETLGAAVLVPNVRGSNGYGKAYMGMDNGFKREDSVRDIGALLDWIATQEDLDTERVAVFGGSYGGYMVLASAVHYSDRLKAAVDIVGISNFVTFLENTKDYRRDHRRAEYGDERDPDMRAHLQAISPLNSVEKIQVPMFVVQGENDPRVPVSEAVQIVAALRDQGQPVWYMNALNEGHGYRKKENRDIYQQATVLFFQQFLLSN